MKNSPTKRNHRLKEYLRFVRRNERVDGTQRTALLHRISWGRRRSRASRGLEVLDDVTPLVLREASTEHHSWVGFLLCNKKKSEFFLDTTARIGRKPHLRRGLRTQPTHVLRYYSAWIGCGVWETGGRGRPTHQSNDCLFVYVCERRKASKHLIQRETTTTTTEAVPARIHQRRWTRTPQQESWRHTARRRRRVWSVFAEPTLESASWVFESVITRNRVVFTSISTRPATAAVG